MSQNAAVSKGIEGKKMSGACDDAGCEESVAFCDLFALCSSREKPLHASRLKIRFRRFILFYRIETTRILINRKERHRDPQLNDPEVFVECSCNTVELYDTIAGGVNGGCW